MQANYATLRVDHRELMELVGLHQLQDDFPAQARRHDQGLALHDGFDATAEIESAQQSPADVAVGDGTEQHTRG